MHGRSSNCFVLVEWTALHLDWFFNMLWKHICNMVKRIAQLRRRQCRVKNTPPFPHCHCAQRIRGSNINNRVLLPANASPPTRSSIEPYYICWCHRWLKLHGPRVWFESARAASWGCELYDCDAATSQARLSAASSGSKSTRSIVDGTARLCMWTWYYTFYKGWCSGFYSITYNML